MKITFIHPPQVFSQYQIATGITPPLGIAYLASFCLRHGYEVRVIDAVGEEPGTVSPFRPEIFLRGKTIADIVDEIDADTDLIGISNLFSFGYPAVRELSDAIRKKHPQTPIVLGGAHPTHMYQEVLNDHAGDYVIRSEGEIPLVDLCRHLAGEIPIEEVPSLAYRGGDGAIRVTENSRRIRELDNDNVPFPARHLLPMENYISSHEAHGPTSKRWTSMITSRGCPYGCTFCNIRRTKWVGRTANDVVDEIEHCMKEWGVKEFHFEDDNMTIRRDRLMAICNEIIARDLNITWQTPNGIRASVTDKEMLTKMRDSGCVHITLAPESGSERVVQELIQKGRDFSHDQLLEVGRMARKLGMKVAAYFVIGMPGERPEDVEETIKYAKKLAKANVDEAGFSLLIPLPGTPIWDEAVKTFGKPDYLDLLIIGDLNNAQSYSPYITSEQLGEFRRRAYLSFFVWRAIYHPIAFAKTILNVLRGVAETKTESYIRTFVKRARQSEEAPSGAPVLLQSDPNYAYKNSSLKAMRLVVMHFAKTLLWRRT